MRKQVISIVAAVKLCCAGQNQINDPSQTTLHSEQLHQTYVDLNRQIYARHSDVGSGAVTPMRDRVKSIEQLHSIIGQEIEAVLGSPNPSAGNITNAISTLQGDMSRSAWDTDATNTPYASLFAINGTAIVAVAYVIMTGGEGTPNTQAYLEFYEKVNGLWAKKTEASTISNFNYSTFSIARMNSGVPGEAWFLAWGVPMGNSVGAEYLRLYAFNGSTVRTAWQRGPVPAGKVQVEPGSVTLDYRDESTPTGLAHEVLHVTTTGLQ